MKKIIFFLLVVSSLFFLSGCFFWEKPKSFLKPKILQNVSEKKEEVKNVPQKINRFLDGLPVFSGEEKALPVAAILENLPGAPKPSLSAASIVYEAPVEGGFTRFLAIFDLNNLPDNLGPIRSARIYLADLAEEYRPVFIHAGGSNDVLFKLKQGFYQLFNFDEISWLGKYFYRSNEPSPHNLYIKKESINKFLIDQKINQEARFEPWLFKREIRGGAKAEEIKINFSSLYQVKWQYNQENREYQYLQNNQVYKDKDGQEIRVKNLVIQYTEIKIIDAEGRRKVKLDGQGQAEIFQNGQVIKGRWFKEAGRTRFYNQTGEEIIFLPGKTWISLVSEKMMEI